MSLLMGWIVGFSRDQTVAMASAAPFVFSFLYLGHSLIEAVYSKYASEDDNRGG